MLTLIAVLVDKNAITVSVKPQGAIKIPALTTPTASYPSTRCALGGSANAKTHNVQSAALLIPAQLTLNAQRVPLARRESVSTKRPATASQTALLITTCVHPLVLALVSTVYAALARSK